MIIQIAQAKAEDMTRNWPSVKSWKPGLKIIIVPTNPANIADQRRIPTFSLKMKTARITVKIGAENERAVTSANGTMLTAKKKDNMQYKLIIPRVKNIGKRLVFKGLIPCLIKKGIIGISPKRHRKKAISKGCILSDMCRIPLCIMDIRTEYKSINKMPLVEFWLRSNECLDVSMVGLDHKLIINIVKCIV